MPDLRVVGGLDQVPAELLEVVEIEFIPEEQKPDNIVDLGPHNNMKPEECFAVCAREEWSDVLVLGFQDDADGVVIRSSHLTREFALWIIEHAKQKIMGLSEDL